jgi:hypothetical protein
MAVGYTGGDPTKVAKSGDTMAGTLVLDDASPAASEAFVEEQISDGAVTSVDGQSGDVDLTGSYAPASTATELTAHEADSTGVHGIADTSLLETQTGATAKVTAHAGAADPHGDRAFTTTAISTHAGASDPHGDRAFATAAIATHTAAADPHGDRAYAAGQATAALSAAESYTDGAVAGLATDASTVHKAGAETITGTKTFSVAPAVPDGSFAVAKLSGLGGAATLNVGTSAGTVAAGDDARLSDTRTPSDSSVTSAKIADGAIVNADINAAAAIALSKLATDPLARANHTGTQAMATISDAGNAATKNVGTTTGTVAAGDDSRFTDQRTPTDNSVTSAKIADGAIVNADVNAAAAIALSKLATDPLARANHTGTQVMATISDAGGAATKNVGTSAGTVAAGDDSRFTDTRTPTDNTVTSAKIVDGTIVNADISAAAGIVLSKLATDPLARANHTGTQLMATISDAGGAATKNVGTSAGTVAAGDDSRFTDTRTPTDNSVTSAKIVDGTIVDADIGGSAAIALSKLATNPLARANHTGTQLASTISDLSTAVDTAGYGAWTDIASLGTNTGHGTPHAQSRTAPGGKTELRGQLLFSGAISANATIATVPAGQLPYGAVTFGARWGGTGSANTFLNIDASGHLSVSTASLVNGNTLNLDGIWFSHA